MTPWPYPCKCDEPLSLYSTLGIGGNARLFCVVSTIEQMQAMIVYATAHAVPYLVIGKGSNCLFDDQGWDGLVLLNKIAFCDFKYPLVHVGAGYSFSLLGAQTARSGWSGLEFASGIPGSVGGAIYMNAGANGTETKDVLFDVHFVDEKGELQTCSKKDLHFDYRFSSFQEKPWAIVSATFLLAASQDARKRQIDIIHYRKGTQPYKERSAGCVFRNPSSLSAGRLIEECDLKEKSIGGAQVSKVHGNFIINKNHAKAQDVLELASFVKEKVKEIKGIELEMEIRHIRQKS